MAYQTRHWRLIAGLTVLALVGSGGYAIAQSGDVPPPEAFCKEVPELGVWVCGTPVELTTTTTVGETTTTEADTTTSSSSTTTTTAPTTTTTTVADGEIPETVPHPDRLTAGEGYTILLTDNGSTWWNAPYIGVGSGENQVPVLKRFLPYAENSYWDIGDRIGYGCAYGFLIHDRELVGRFTAVRVPQAFAYAKVNDRFMVEGHFYWDWSETPFVDNIHPRSAPGGEPSGQAYKASWCATIVTADYQPYNGPGNLPRIPFWQGGEVLEIRDYRGVQAASDIKFRMVEYITEPFQSCDGGLGNQANGENKCVTVNQRVTVVAYENNLPVIIFYYDSLGSGLVTVDFPAG